MKARKIWRLKKGADRRLRQGHPWVFASELSHSAKEVTAGEMVELRDAQDHFLAYGYAHPSSQICFRKLSGNSRETDVMSVEFFRRRLRQARDLRATAGWTSHSHRWLFAEADGVPGLIVDAFQITESGLGSRPDAGGGPDGGKEEWTGGGWGRPRWIVVVQASTAGAESALSTIYEALSSFAGELSGAPRQARNQQGDGGTVPEPQAAGHDDGVWIVESPSSRARTLEGLDLREKRVVAVVDGGGGLVALTPSLSISSKASLSTSRSQSPLSSSSASALASSVPSGLDLTRVPIRLVDGLVLECDLLHGQKTGFFLDQQWNCRLLKQLLHHCFGPSNGPREDTEPPVRVLDLCCYVGQWGSHVARALGQAGRSAEVTLVDASAEALRLAEQNVRRAFTAGANEGAADSPGNSRAGAAVSLGIQAAQADVLQWSCDERFDVVICDPPAFVKKKTDLEAGLRAYVKLNREAVKWVRPGGLFVSSSCSGLVKTSDFARVLMEASQKAGRSFKQIYAGGHAPDHPVRPEFPEGEYLKCAIGRVDYPF